jgi:hypothetical protein
MFVNASATDDVPANVIINVLGDDDDDDVDDDDFDIVVGVVVVDIKTSVS